MFFCVDKSFYIIPDAQTNFTDGERYAALFHDSVIDCLGNLPEIPAPVRLDDKFFRVCLCKRSARFRLISICKYKLAFIGGFFIAPFFGRLPPYCFRAVLSAFATLRILSSACASVLCAPSCAV